MNANTKSVTLVNVLSVDPAKQRELLDLLRQNTESVVTTLKGWIATNLVASNDGKQVVIYSQWETAQDLEAMRTDSRMQAYFPRIAALASFESVIGTAVMAHQR